MQGMEMEEGGVKPQQISELFQRLATVCKTKTLEFFAEEDEYEQIPSVGVDDFDSKEALITDQKVVVIKPDHLRDTSPEEKSRIGTSTHLDSLLSCVFANVSAFESAYVQLQTSHSPFDMENMKAADRAAVAQLRNLSAIKHSYRNSGKSPSLNWVLEAQVEERQSVLRTYEMTVNRLQSEIDRMDSEASTLKEQIGKMGRTHSSLERRWESWNAGQISTSLSVFDSALMKSVRLSHSFTQIFIDYMKRARWDLDSAANALHPSIDYAKKGHNRYAFLSYVCLEMFAGFDSKSFSEMDVSTIKEKDPVKRFVQFSSMDPLEALKKHQQCGFVKFCQKKYVQILHPKMEASFFGNLDYRDLVLNCSCSKWPITNPLFDSFLKMAYSIWLLHLLASAFRSQIGIFQVKRGAQFSVVFMENVVQGHVLLDSETNGKRPAVGFSVIPGFRVGETVIQCQVYLNGMKCIVQMEELKPTYQL